MFFKSDSIKHKLTCLFVLYRLFDGIQSHPENWTNCKMFVQDFMRPDINITAEISEKAAANFQQMCQQFAEKFNG